MLYKKGMRGIYLYKRENVELNLRPFGGFRSASASTIVMWFTITGLFRLCWNKLLASSIAALARRSVALCRRLLRFSFIYFYFGRGGLKIK